MKKAIRPAAIVLGFIFVMWSACTANPWLFLVALALWLVSLACRTAEPNSETLKE